MEAFKTAWQSEGLFFTVTTHWHKQLNFKCLQPFYQQRGNVFGDEVVEVCLITGTERSLVLPLLWRKGPLHVHCRLQERSQFWTQWVWRKELCFIIFWRDKQDVKQNGEQVQDPTSSHPFAYWTWRWYCATFSSKIVHILPLCVIVLFCACICSFYLGLRSKSEWGRPFVCVQILVVC